MPSSKIQFGCRLTKDKRDKRFRVPYRESDRTYRYWTVPRILNQGSTNMCVAYAWLGFFADSPMPQRPIPFYPPKKLYRKALELDEYPGEDDLGTSVRGGAKAAIALGQKIEYRWAQTIEEVIATVLEIGPMVVGTIWLPSMMNPKGTGPMKIDHKVKTFPGAHAYVLSGVNTKDGVFRLQNSWGTAWANKGQAIITIDDFAKLNKYGYEACIAMEL